MTIKFTLRFLRPGEHEDSDDVITASTSKASPDLFHISYRPGDTDARVSYQATMSRSTLMDYVQDILESMTLDVDPFDRIQLLTDIHPTVMYSASDMDNRSTRNLLRDMIYSSLRTRVVRVELA
jgi:hypothetical protein